MQPTIAAGADEALRLLAEADVAGPPYSVAILDFQMPGVDGIELGRAIRAGNAGMRLVLLTSSARRGHARIARDAGFDGFLTKPVKVAALYDCLAMVIGRPITDPTSLVTSHSLADAPSAARALLLVVDDNPVNQRVAARMLEKLGHRVNVAENGHQAVAAVTTGGYSLVLMDCHMPEMDGFEATREIRRREGSRRHTPIIAMTADAMVGAREECLAAGMDDYISKPVDLQELTAVMAPWLSRAGALQPHDRREAVTPPHLDEATPDPLRDLGSDQ